VSLRLEGKVALVTGASRGIGRVIAETLAEAGATVVLGARDAARLTECVSAIEARGGRAEAVSLDVATKASVEAAIGVLLAKHGRLDVLVNNAGITRDNLLLRMKTEEWDAVLATNLTGAFLCTQLGLEADAEAEGRAHRERHLRGRASPATRARPTTRPARPVSWASRNPWPARLLRAGSRSMPWPPASSKRK
jgi:NAD(P)-dependent dehydrogenase (short-subunit alcohol dehydrogenase family)